MFSGAFNISRIMQLKVEFILDLDVYIMCTHLTMKLVKTDLLM